MRLLITLLVATAVSLNAQALPTSRAEEIELAREAKSETIKPEESPTEAKINEVLSGEFVQKVLVGGEGFAPRLGGLPTGQGFALGVGYRDSTLSGGALRFESSIAGSASRAWVADVGLYSPDLVNGHLFFDTYAKHSNYPRFEYFGSGPDSSTENGTTFRIEESSVDFNAGVRPFKTLRMGVTGGYVLFNTGPGNDTSDPQLGEFFTDATTPGLTDQTDFLRGGFFVDFDNRDFPGAPRNGGLYSARFLAYSDRDIKQHSHQRLEIDAQQYIPFFNDRRVIALRGKTIMTYGPGTQNVPFYLQPVLGGSDDLRGFQQFRFYGNNLVILNAEYRWEAFSGLDMAVFFDAGKVANRRSQINFHDLEASAGLGWRFNIQNSVFLRIDVAKSHEGYQLWFKFGKAF